MHSEVQALLINTAHQRKSVIGQDFQDNVCPKIIHIFVYWEKGLQNDYRVTKFRSMIIK